MPDDKEFEFTINAYTPTTIPMGRLAAYMDKLANLLGEHASVHFVRLDAGSTVVVHKIEHEAQPKVAERLSLIKSGNAPDDVKKAEKEINEMLKKDNTYGSYAEKKGAEIIEFPGVKHITQDKYGPIKQHGTLDGVVVRVGGKQDIVPVLLQTRDGFENTCVATREVARDLAKHIYADEIRCTGMGAWVRDEEGIWQLERFYISGFELLDQRPLPEIVADLRTVEGNGWRNVEDPWSELANLQEEESDGT